jgi:hypothetical protein
MLNTLTVSNTYISMSRLIKGFALFGNTLVLKAKLSSMYKYNLTYGSPSKFYSWFREQTSTFSSVLGSM